MAENTESVADVDIKIPKKKLKKKKRNEDLDEDFVPNERNYEDGLETPVETEQVKKTTNRGVGKAYFDEVLKRIEERRKHNVKISDEECQMYCRQLVERMIAAADEDVQCVKMGKPGLAKLKMLNAISNINKPTWRKWCIAEGVAVALASWLAVLPDGSLPNLSVRSKVLQIAHQLPFQSSDLRDNDLGRIIISLWKHPDECESNKTLIRAIVQKWTRPMLGLASSYADIQHDTHFIINNDVLKFKNYKSNQEKIKSKLSQMYRHSDSKHKAPNKATKVKLTGGI